MTAWFLVLGLPQRISGEERFPRGGGFCYMDLPD